MSTVVTRRTVLWAVIVLTALNLLDYFDRYIVASVNTLIKHDFGLSDKAFGFLGSAFFLVYLASAPVFGYLGDRYGRRNFMVLGAALWSLATSLAYWVTTYAGLVVARGLVGLGEASFGTLAPAYLADMLPLAQRGRVLGIFYTTIPVGAALAYYFGGQVGAAWGWRWSFLLAGLPGLIMAGLVYTLPSLAANTSGQAAGSHTVGRAQLQGIVELFRIPTFVRVTIGYGFLTFALGGLAFWMPHFLEVDKGLSLKEANLLMALVTTVAGGLGTLAGGFGGDWLFRRTPKGHLLVSGLGVALALPFGALAIVAREPWLYQASLFMAVFLLFLNPGLLTTLIVSVAGPSRRATAVALNIIIIHFIGDMPSPFLIGWLSDLAGLAWGVALTLAALTISAIILLSGLKRVAADLTET
ncbi:MAG: spinster family MFS transporter [Desulfobacca sp.]|uniref:spinster family MFS transporter n=1 Tax=Desulfobacca sp. TaxID=2067990 RepID=UPI00404B13AC